MGIWSIYRNSGQAPNMIAVCDSLEYHGEWMGDCFLTVSVKSPTPVTFRVGDYVEYRGEKYYIDYDPNTIKKAESGTYKEGFTYDGIKLYSEFHALSDIMMKDYVLNDNGLAYSQQANFSFFASSVEDLADRIQANLDKATKGQNWKVVTPNPGRSEYRNGGTDITASERRKYYGAYPDGGYRDVNVVCNSIMLTDAVKMAYDLFGLSFFVTDRRIIIGGTPQPVSSSLSYGKGYGLYEVEKVTDESQRVVTKMYAYGSSDNLPLNYYANLHKQYKAIVSKVDKSSTQYYYCEFTLSMSYKPSMFTEVCKWTDSSGNTYNNMGYVVKIKLGSTEITARVNNPKDSTDGLVHIYAEYVAGSEDPSDEPNEAKMSAFITSLTVGQTIYFTAGIDKNRWPTSGIDYGDSANYPALLSISNLMLPGFPDQSLYEWVASHGGTDLNESSGQATYNGHTAYFSKEKMSPWIMSVKADTLGEREGAVYFDGSSNDTENIYPTIESTGGNVVTYGSSITDNGYLADNTDLSFSIEITAAGDLDWRELYNSRQEDAYLNMKSGYCTGRAFKILSLPKKTGSSWTVKLERSKDGSLDRYFPYQDMSATYSKYAQIRKNDTFVVTGIQLPKDYVDAASKKLLEAALERLEAIDHPKQTYIPKIDELWAARDYDKKHTTSTDTSLYTNIYPGMNFSFEDADVLGAGVTMTRVIDSLTIKEDGNNGIPTFDVVLREEKEETFEQRVQSQMSSGSSGSGKSSSVQGITEDDIDSYVDGMMKADMFSKLFEVHGKIKNGKLDVNGTDTKIGYKDWKEVFDDDDAKWKKWETDHAQDNKPYESLLSIKAKRGLWSEFFISALGIGGSGMGTPFELNEPLNSLNDMKSLPTTVGHTIVWTSSGWGFGKAGGGEELGDVLQNIKDNSPSPGDRGQYKTLEYDGANWKYGYLLRRLNVTNHKEDETTGYTTIAVDIVGPQSEINLYQILNDYLKQDDADDRYVKIDWFKSLFKVHTGANDAAGTEIEPNNDLPSGGFNIESLVGFWTKKWVSALGANGSGSGGGTAFDLSPILADINLSPLQPTAAGALYYNGSAGSWSFVPLNQGINEATLQNYLTTNKYIKGDESTKWWGQAMGSDKLVKGDMTDVGDFTTAKGKRFFAKVDSSNFEFLSPYWTDSRTYLTYAPSGLVIRLGDSSRPTAMLIDGSRNVGIGTESPSVKLDVNGSAYANRFYLRKPDSNGNGAIYFVWDNNSTTPGVHLVGAGLWSDSYISALGSNPTQGTGFEANRLVASLNDSTLEPLGVSGKVLVNNNGTWSWEDYGAGGGLDEGAMWAALGGAIDTKKIDNSHLSLKSLTFKAGASDTGVAYSPADNADKTITFDAKANSGISVEKDSNGTFIIGYTMPDVTLAQITDTDTTYTRFVVDAKGRVVKADKPTTLAEYGITDALTDAKIKSGYTWWGQKLDVNGKVNGMLSVDLTTVGATTLGSQYSVMQAKYKNARGSEYGYNSIISLVGSGETDVTYNMGVRLGSQSGMTWISAGESGGTLSSVFTDMCNTEDVYISADGGIHLITGASNDSTSYVRAMDILSNGNVGIGNASPSYKLDVNGTVNATEFRVGDNYITTHDTTNKYLKIISAKEDIRIGTGNNNNTLHINYGGVGTNERVVTDYQWHAGSSTTWASHRVGRIYLYRNGDSSSGTNARNVYIEIDENGDVKLNGNFYATGAVSALGSKDSGGQDYFNVGMMWEELAKTGSDKINNSHLSLSSLSITTKNGTTTYTPTSVDQTIDLSSLTGDSRTLLAWENRPSTANTEFGDGKLRYYLSSGNMSTGKPTDDGHIIHMSWDWEGKSDAQIFVSTWNPVMKYRSMDGTTWREWKTVLDTDTAASTYLAKTDISSWAKATTKPTYSWSEITDKPLSGNSGNFGPVWGNYVPVKSDGVMEVGLAIDFHNTSNDGEDFAVRLQCQGVNKNIVYLPTSAGTLALTSQLSDYLSRSGGSMKNTNLVSNLNADMLDGKHLVTRNLKTPFDRVMYIDDAGVMEAGAYLDFHHNNNGDLDFSTRLYVGGGYSNMVMLPSSTGTLALTSDLTGYLSLSGGAMKNTNKVTNMNADLLDGRDSTYFVNTGSTWSKDAKHDGYILEFRNTTASTSDNPFSVLGGNAAVVIQNLPDSANWGAQLAFGFGSARLLWRNRQGSQTMSDWVGVIAGSADKLVTKRKIWGQDFDGTANVDGRFELHHNLASTTSWATGSGALAVLSDTSNSAYAIGLGVSKEGGFGEIQASQYGVGASSLVLQKNGGNVGVGITSPKYKLHVNGFTYTSRLYLAENVYLEKTIYGVHLVGAGFYSDSFVSALGSNPDTPGGGGGVIELTGILGSLYNSTTSLSTGALYYNGSTWSFQTLNQGTTLSAPLNSINGIGNPTGSGKQMLCYESGWKYISVPKSIIGLAVHQDNKQIGIKDSDNNISGYITVPFATNATDATNADKLDGKHASYFVNSGTTWSKSTKHDGFIVEFRNSVAETGNNPFSILGGNAATVIQNLPDNSTYGAQLAFGFGSARLLWRARNNSASFSDWVGIIAGSADKLASKKKLWGQDFDGTSDVTGSITDCTSIDSLLYFDTTNKRIGVSLQSPLYTLDVSGNIRATQSSWFPSVHLFADSSNSTPYIDFHYNHATDYTTRIIESTSGALSIVAKTGTTGLVVGTSTYGDSIQIGGATLKWTANGLECNTDFYSTGAVSALGSNTSGGGGGISDISVDASLSGTILTINVSGQSDTVDLSSISGTSGNYIPLSGSDEITGDLQPASNDAKDLGNSQGNRWRQIHGKDFIGETIELLEDKNEINFRTTVTDGFGCKVGYRTRGEEALVFANKNASTSFIFYTGQELTETESATWDYGTPAMQIKKNCVYINTLISNGVNPSYSLYVVGSGYFTGSLTTQGLTANEGSFAKLGIGGKDNDNIFYVNGTSNFAGNMSMLTDFHIKQYAPYTGAIAYQIGTDTSNRSVYAQGIWSGTFVSGGSDIRLKDVVCYPNLTIDDIAKAPIFNFTWKDRRDNTTHLGTSAQYWKEILPSVIYTLPDNYLTMEYQTTALAAAVFTARKVVDHELRIKQLEQENAILRKEIEELKAA